jgi:hypothetical protein
MKLLNLLLRHLVTVVYCLIIYNAHIIGLPGGYTPGDNQGETRGNLVFCLCILPVNPGEITNFAIIGRWGEGK